MSERNRIGWVLENTTVRDVIAVLTGSGDPVALRPREDGYTVIGTASHMESWMARLCRMMPS